MADIDTELGDLLNTFAEADRPTIRTLLTNNPAAVTRLTTAQNIYTAFIDGDTKKLDAAVAGVTPPAVVPPAAGAAATTTPPANQSLSLGLDQINALLTEHDKRILSSPELAALVDKRAEEKAQAKFEAERASVIGRSAEISDTITSIRESHLREFNEPLDSAAFKTFYAAEGPKYGNDLQTTYNAFVGEKRTAKKIADGIKAGLEAAATAATPGTTVPTVNNPMAPNFVDFNVRKIDPAATVTPSADADKAAQAFASMQRGWTQ